MSKIIENIDDVKLLINKYEWLVDQSKRLLDDRWLDEVENLEWNDDNLIVHYSTYCKGCYDHDCENVPIAWLFLDDEELEKAKKEKKEAEEEVRRKQKELNEILKKQAQEQKDREEYERLKAKFEK
jgi:predicted Fe-S protein YdhL (DUF1289 family)